MQVVNNADITCCTVLMAFQVGPRARLDEKTELAKAMEAWMKFVSLISCLSIGSAEGVMHLRDRNKKTCLLIV